MTYPDAIAKFDWLPQLFSALFFLMLFIVGLGSNLGVTTSIVTAIKDQCPELKNWQVVSAVAVAGFSFGIVYLTPGGMHFLDILDYYGAKYVTLTFAVLELATLAWIYGVDRICRDIKFMLGIETSLFWRICWGVVTPLVTVAILLLSFIDYEAFVVPVGYNGKNFVRFPFQLSQYSFHLIMHSTRLVHLHCGRAPIARLGIVCHYA